MNYYNQTYIPYRGAFTGPSFQSALNPRTLAASGSVSSNGFNLTAGAAAITGGFASALSGNPVSAPGADLSGVITNAQGAISGADLNKVVDLGKGASNQLIANSSNLIPPPNAFRILLAFLIKSVGPTNKEPIGAPRPLDRHTERESA